MEDRTFGITTKGCWRTPTACRTKPTIMGDGGAFQEPRGLANNSACKRPCTPLPIPISLSRTIGEAFFAPLAINVVGSLASFELKRPMSKTGVFKPILPYSLPGDLLMADRNISAKVGSAQSSQSVTQSKHPS